MATTAIETALSQLRNFKVLSDADETAIKIFIKNQRIRALNELIMMRFETAASKAEYDDITKVVDYVIDFCRNNKNVSTLIEFLGVCLERARDMFCKDYIDCKILDLLKKSSEEASSDKKNSSEKESSN